MPDSPNSSRISSYDYDPEAKTLSVTFRGTGAIYHYRGVPPEAYKAMQEAPSKGSFLNKNIEKTFKFTKIAGGR
jgi:hypothetical protein